MATPANPAPAGLRMWMLGARPRTLPASAVPVVVGTAVAGAEGHVIWWRAVAALVVALGMQIGTNYANDYSDGVRGTDAAGVRVGPVRLVGWGLAPSGAVRLAALGSFVVAGAVGLALAAAAGWWLVLVGVACVSAGWFYTGGPRPYGYVGLGELFVFVFFGLVATAGTAYVQLERVTGLAVAAAVPVGVLAVSMLVVNNLRDIPGDTVSGKKTLAVRLGDARTRVGYLVCVSAPFAVAALLAVSRVGALLALGAVPLAVGPVRAVRSGAAGRDLIPVLSATGRLQLAFGALLGIGIAIG